jgi:hypothetical protein
MGKTHSIQRERFVSFAPSLACHLGVNEAIVVQTISWLLTLPKSGRMIKGEKFVYNSLEEWQRDWFPFWNKRTLQRVFKSLVDAGILVTESPDGRGTVNHYRINHAAYEMLLAENAPHQAEDYGQIVQGTMDNLSTSYKTVSSSESTKGYGTSVPHAGFLGFNDRNPRTYPTSEAIYNSMLEDAGEEWTEHDPKIYAEFTAFGWKLNGKPIGDWILARNAIIQVIENSKKTNAPRRK